MKYIPFVTRNQAKFVKTGLLKHAQDAANILDNLLASLDLKGWNAEEDVSLRERVYHLLCALCLRSDVRLPKYEKLFFEAWLPKFESYVKDEERAEKIRRAKDFDQQVRQRVMWQRSQEAQLCRALAKVYRLFPAAENSYRAIKPKQLQALINQSLVQMGLEPIRPNYDEIKIPDTNGIESPSKPVKVLIVDDGLKEIVKSAARLIGWPNLVVEFYHYSEGVKKKDYASAADKVLDRNPDVVLMDQGLADLDGHRLVEMVKNISQRKIIFVANTGGNGQELRSVGCLENFDKGKSIGGLIQALKMIK